MRQHGQVRSSLGRWPDRSRRERSRGQSLVEFAVVVSLVFLPVLVGILDFGFLLYARMTVINAAREGAQVASVDAVPSTIQSVAQTNAQDVAGGLATTVTVTCWANITTTPVQYSSCSSANPGDSVKVTVAYGYHPFFPLYFGNTINLSSTVQMVIYPATIT